MQPLKKKPKVSILYLSSKRGQYNPFAKVKVRPYSHPQNANVFFDSLKFFVAGEKLSVMDLG
jgi:hypothetical protein